MAVTEMACLSPEGVMEQEKEFLSALGAAERYQIRDGRLHIACVGDRELVFRIEGD
jgi:heat shock protein HslJ